MPKKWEYKAVVLYIQPMSESELNALGDEGWELVAVAVEAGMAVGTLLFKREKA